MTHHINPVRSALMLGFVVSTLGWAGAVSAASACKGLEQAICETTEECRWQAGYTRKDGIEVASHCRSTGKKKKEEVAPKAGLEVEAEPAT